MCLVRFRTMKDRDTHRIDEHAEKVFSHSMRDPGSSPGTVPRGRDHVLSNAALSETLHEADDMIV